MHEKKHRDDPSTWQPFGHVDAILTQINDKSFANSTDKFKQAAGVYAANLLNEALKLGASKEDVMKKIDVLNNSKLGDSILLFYDEVANETKTMVILNPVEITSEPNEK